MSEVKKSILGFVRSYNEVNGKPPSLKVISQGVEGVSKRRFYALFPGGMGEACRLAGIPVPKDRIKATKKARKSRESKTPRPAYTTRVSSPGIVLTESQVARLLGIAHLEGGKNIELVIDEILDRDTRLREEKKLTLDDTQVVFDYIDRAKERTWDLDLLLNIHTRLWNAGLMRMSSQAVEGLVGFLEKMKARGWDSGEIPDLLSNPFVKDIMPRLSSDEGVELVELLREIGLKGLTVGQYLKEVAEVRQAINLFQEYFNGRITAEKLMRMVQAH